MIIKSIFINQFGGLKDFFMEFSDGFNQINAENEYGKSTIAEFIKIMLYGTGKSVRDIRENERLKYMPWNDKKMGGEITVSHDDTEYTIIRTFGLRKSSDTVKAIYTLTGKDADFLSTNAPGEVLTGVGRDAFEKSLYIKQLSNKISAETDDEILKRLVNLAQSGEEETSFGTTDKLLESAQKELSGTRPKGKMLVLKEEIASLYSKRNEISEKKASHQEMQNKISSLKAKQSILRQTNTDDSFDDELSALAKKRAEAMLNQEKVKKSKKLIIISLILSILLAVAVYFYKWFLAPIPLIWTTISIILLFKKKASSDKAFDFDAEEEKIKRKAELLRGENLDKLINISEEISALEQKLSDFEVCSDMEIQKQISDYENQYREYERKFNSLALIRKALREAFDELQKSFGTQLNDATSRILKEITGGKYCEVFVDETYEMSVRCTETNEIIKAEFLSGGAYDQIYFALRMAICELLFSDLPLILDEPFAQYDKTREKYAMDYLKSLTTNQIIIFSH